MRCDSPSKTRPNSSTFLDQRYGLEKSACLLTDDNQGEKSLLVCQCCSAQSLAPPGSVAVPPLALPGRGPGCHKCGLTIADLRLNNFCCSFFRNPPSSISNGTPLILTFSPAVRRNPAPCLQNEC